ncbi:MAG: hypothetical protein IRY87_29360 [Acetobacteraceae bacterium]|nr:hypothetical protein [Acetobacteraceae bacterium]
MARVTQDDRFALVVGSLLGLAAAAALVPAGGSPGRRRDRLALPCPRRRDGHGAAQTHTARMLNTGSAVLSLSVLADSGLEHYRGRYFNPAMFIPPVVSTLTLAASLHGAGDASRGTGRLRDAIYGLAALAGVVGTGFHIYNIGKRVGGYSWGNFFFGAPVGAPMALFLAGIFGKAAEAVRDTKPGRVARLFSLPAGRALAGMTSAALLGTVGEVGLLHFRGAYHNPAMFLPVTLPPVAAGLMAAAAADERPKHRPVTRIWLWLTGLLGFVGTGFHIYGVARNMGGWHNWSQNVMNGPPIPAPPSFTGLALTGLAALNLAERRGHG